MAEKPDADGDASIVGVIGSADASPEGALDGRRIALTCGGELVFERTEAMWTVAVRPVDAQAPTREALVALVNGEAAVAVSEALSEYDVRGTVAIAFMGGMPLDTFSDLVDDLSERLDGSKTRISGDAGLSVALVERRGRTIA